MALSTRMCRNSPSAQSRYTVLVDTRRHAATPFTVSSVRIRPRRAFGRVCSLGPCRLQNVSETAAELGGSCGTLRTLVYLATYCAFERIDELACVAALLAILLLETSVPYTPPLQGLGFPPQFGRGPWASGFWSDALSLDVTALRLGKPEGWGCGCHMAVL